MLITVLSHNRERFAGFLKRALSSSDKFASLSFGAKEQNSRLEKFIF